MGADKKRIWIHGQFVEVTEEVYRAYMQGDRKMRYFEHDLKTQRFVFGKEGQVVQVIPRYTFRIRAYKTSGDTVIYSNYTRLAAVSYTHLDVYKRQYRYCCRCRKEGRIHGRQYGRCTRCKQPQSACRSE